MRFLPALHPGTARQSPVVVVEALIVCRPCLCYDTVRAQHAGWGALVVRFSAAIILAVLICFAVPEAFAQPPKRLYDRQGRDLGAYFWNDINCTAAWDEYCEGYITVEISNEYEYCTHAPVVYEWNQAEFQVVEVNRHDVTFYYRADGSGLFFDRRGGNVNMVLVVGVVPTGQYSTQRCAPRRKWAKYCTGGSNCYSSACGHYDALTILADPQCRSAEGVPNPRPQSTPQPRRPNIQPF